MTAKLDAKGEATDVAGDHDEHHGEDERPAGYFVGTHL